MRKTIAIDILAGIFAVVFIYAATSKLIDYQQFLVDISKSPILTAHAQFFSIATPSIEILISIALLFKKTFDIALYACFSLMVMFTTYIVIILNFSPFIPCSCGGIIQNFTWTQHLVFNIFLIVLSIIAIFLLPVKKEYMKDQLQVSPKT